MSLNRFTRRRFILAGAASAAGVGAVAGTNAGGATDDRVIVGRFVHAQGPRAAVVAVDGGTSVTVTLDSGAFVAHGADGIVDSLSAFVPGERVVARGDRAGDDFAAVEFQSVYTQVSGVYTSDAAGHWLVTPSGKRVRVPEGVLRRDAPTGLAAGERRTPTVWTHPRTGEATAVDID